MELVAFLGSDKENWGQISALIKRGQWEKVILVQNREAESFPHAGNSEIVKIDSEQPILQMKEELLEKLKKKLAGGFEVSLSLASGNGKEHMALIGALLGIPVGIRIVVFTKNGVENLT